LFFFKLALPSAPCRKIPLTDFVSFQLTSAIGNLDYIFKAGFNELDGNLTTGGSSSRVTAALGLCASMSLRPDGR
jgi:hypothetical protein